jgi:hypothetical protein
MVEFKLRRQVESIVVVGGEERTVKETVDFDMCYDPKQGTCWFVGKNSTPFSISKEMIKVITQK